MSAKLHAVLCDHLEKIAALYKVRPRITLIVRVPGAPDQGTFLSDDSWADAVAAVEYLQGNAAYMAGPPEPNPETRVFGYSAAYRQAYEVLSRIPEQCLSTWESDARDALRALLAAGPDGKGKP